MLIMNACVYAKSLKLNNKTVISIYSVQYVPFTKNLRDPSCIIVNTNITVERVSIFINQ